MKFVAEGLRAIRFQAAANSTGAITLKIKQRSIGLSRTVSFASYGLSQEEILQHELPFPSCKRAAASLARYLAIVGLRPSLDFDDLIKRVAVRACEWIERASRHGTPPNTQFLIVICESMPAPADAQLPFDCHTRQSCCVWSETLLS